jgi:predicted nucleic acid-binding protein
VDTSGWAAPVVLDTPHYQELETFSRDIIAGNRPLVTTNYVITELVALLTIRTRLSRPRILHFVNQIKSLAQIVYVDEVLDQAAWVMLEHYDDKDWSLVDAASFVIMWQRGIIEAFTTDQHFIQAGFLRMPIQ